MGFPDVNGERRKHDGKTFQVAIRHQLVTEIIWLVFSKEHEK